MSSDEPKDAHCFYNGQYCKVGKHNKVFVHRNGEWVSTKGITVDDISKQIIKQELKDNPIAPSGRRRRRDRGEW